MNYYHEISTSCFKVNDPRNFKEELENNFEADKINIEADKLGFRVWGTNMSNTLLENETEFSDLALLIKEYIRDDLSVVITHFYRDDSFLDIEFSMEIVTSLGIARECSSEVERKLRLSVFTRKVQATTTVNHYEHKELWLKKGEQYLAEERYKHKGRWYYIIKHRNGKLIKWPQENFNDPTLSGDALTSFN